MSVKRLLLLAVCFCFFACMPCLAGIPKVLVVLVYHHIQNEPTSDVSCSPEQFETQLQAILTAGYTPVNLEQATKFLAGGLKEDIEKPVLITFDDGYASLFYYALPVARKLQIPMTVFVVTARIGRRMQFADYLQEHQIMEMHRSGLWEFGSHTHDLHTDSLRIFEAFGPVSNNPVLELLERDLRASSAKLEALLGKKPEAIAWPYGKFNSRFTAIARNNGFKLHFTSCSGYNESGANPFAIKRIPVTARDNSFSVLKKLSRIR